MLERYFKILAGDAEAKYLSANIDSKIAEAEKIVESCHFCERRCGANRKTALGWCRVGYESFVASAFEHWGEEQVLIPSGTIFFSGCTARCVFCQNWDISQNPKAGAVWSPEKIASWIKSEYGCVKNINFVGGEPTPHLHNILKALKLCDANIPMVWNSNFYMSTESMDLLDGVVDIYLTDFKYGDDECAAKYSALPKYMEVVARNHLLAIKNGEMIIRHLVLPGHVECCSKKIIDWIAENLGDAALLNVMSQYRPCFEANKYPEINRGLQRDEYKAAVEYARQKIKHVLAQPI